MLNHILMILQKIQHIVKINVAVWEKTLFLRKCFCHTNFEKWHLKQWEFSWMGFVF